MMEILQIMSLIAEIQRDAPVLLPDALKMMRDQRQVFEDFAKLVSDYQALKGGSLPGPG